MCKQINVYVYIIVCDYVACSGVIALRRMRYKFEIDFKVSFLYGGLVYIFYRHNIVGNNTYSKYTKMGGTLPAFKYEIEDFFFTRLGTGRTGMFPKNWTKQEEKWTIQKNTKKQK